MKKSCKLFVLLAMVLIVGMTLTACGTVKLNDDNNDKETTQQNQWWVGTYDWVSFCVVGTPDTKDQISINYIKNQYPSNTYGDTLELTKDGRIIDTQWGCLDSANDVTTNRTYIVDDTKDIGITYGAEKEVVIKRLATSVQDTDDYFIITESGAMYQLMGASEYSALFFKLQKRSE